MLFFIYTHQNHLQSKDSGSISRSDEVMNAAFGGNIPATFYSEKQDNKSVKILMTEYEKMGNKPLNTYEIMRRKYSDFDPQRIKTSYYQNIAALNYFSKEVLNSYDKLKNALAIINDETQRQQMLKEHNIVKQVSMAWNLLRSEKN